MAANKLNNSDIINIRRNYTQGATTAMLALAYGVTQRTIQRIVNGSIWNSVPMDQPLKGFGGKYEITADGRIWSTIKNDYVSVSANGTARLSQGGQKITVNINTLIEKHFA